MSQQENITVDLPNASARAGYALGLGMCSKVLWDTAVNIKDDQSQGFSERLAIVKVLKEIHEQIQAEVEKINGNANKSAGIDRDSQERQQASE
jgi:hypothetical protein